MAKNICLDEAYQKYISGNLGKRSLEELIYEYVIENYHKVHLFDRNKDKCVDILSDWYPRIHRVIDTYQNLSFGFENYIINKINQFTKECKSKELYHRITEHNYWETNLYDDIAVSDNSSDYLGDYLDHKEADISLFSPRQIHILLLKSYLYADEDLVSRVALFINIDKEKLMGMIERLKEIRHLHDEKIKTLKQRLVKQYNRKMMWSKRLHTCPNDVGRYEILKNRLNASQKRYEKTRSRFSSMKRSASNKQVAEVMGIPKGTVDTHVATIKHKIQRMGLKFSDLPTNLYEYLVFCNKI